MGILLEYFVASFVQQADALELHQSSRGAGASIIEILEVIESDSQRIWLNFFFHRIRVGVVLPDFDTGKQGHEGEQGARCQVQAEGEPP